MQKHSKAVEPTARIAETLWNMNPQSVESVTQTYKAWLDQTNKIQEETVRFAQERFAKDLEAAARLARCSNPTEAMAVQTEFANTMAADYLSESQRVFELMGEIAKQISSVPSSHKAHH